MKCFQFFSEGWHRLCWLKLVLALDMDSIRKGRIILAVLLVVKLFWTLPSIDLYSHFCTNLLHSLVPLWQLTGLFVETDNQIYLRIDVVLSLVPWSVEVVTRIKVSPGFLGRILLLRNMVLKFWFRQCTILLPGFLFTVLHGYPLLN